MDQDNILQQMTLEDKIALCSGRSFWETKHWEKYAIASLFMCDGPHGLRKQEDAADMLGVHASRGNVLYPRGGSAMVTVHQVGQALASALERTQGGRCWPIGYYNLTWKQMLAIMVKHMGCPGKKVTTIPNWMFTLGCKSMLKKQLQQGIEGGLYLPKLADIQCRNLFIDKALGCEPLGVEPDDLDAAIGDSMRLCAAILDGKARTIGMKGE